jgi:hypothetical protein
VATGNADSGERNDSACGTRTRRGAADRSRCRKRKRSRRCAGAGARTCTDARTGIDIRTATGTEGKTEDEIEAGAVQQTRRYRSAGCNRLRCRGQRPVRSRPGGDAGGPGRTKIATAR